MDKRDTQDAPHVGKLSNLVSGSNGKARRVSAIVEVVRESRRADR